MSSEMEKGRKWSPEISDRLGETRFGLLCLTRENLNAPWLLFEAGALSKTRGAYVWTFLHGLSPADVEQPLAQFQHTVSEKADVRKLVHTINQAVREEGEKSLTETTLDKVFETFWPELESGLRILNVEQPPRTSEIRSDRDILEEILQLMRSEQRPSDAAPAITSGGGRYGAPSIDDFVREVSKITITLDAPESDAKAFVDNLPSPLSRAVVQMTLQPGTDQVTSIILGFPGSLFIPGRMVSRLITYASDAVPVKLRRWEIQGTSESNFTMHA
jgi:hypothetical protein